jgi:signal transduction protein with GAF and PtsI domain
LIEEDGVKDWQLERYERIIELNRHLSAMMELPPLLQLIVEAARELTDSGGSSILLVDRKSGDLYFEATAPTKKEEFKRFLVPMDGSISGWVVQHNEPLVVADAQENDRHFRQVVSRSALPRIAWSLSRCRSRGRPSGR